MTDRKSEIVWAALRLFAARGYDAVSMEEIAAAVGMRAPSLYNHYAGKRKIFRAILMQAEAYDAAFAEEAGLPVESAAETPDAYRAVPLTLVASFAKRMLRHWTEDPFFCQFRRWLTVEQFGSTEMQALYHQYLCSGPVGYLTDLFTPLFGEDAAALAASYYAPQFLGYSLYDAAEDKPQVLAAVDAQIDRSTAALTEKQKRGNTDVFLHNQPKL